MSKDSKNTIKTIKLGELPQIKTPKSKNQTGLDVTQRGLEITNYNLNTEHKKKN